MLLLFVTACGPPKPVVYPEKNQPWMGSRKKTLGAAESALRAAMSQGGVKVVQAPGNEEPVMIDKTCVNGAWFTLPGAAKSGLGESFQYSWHVCVGDGEQFTMQLSCLEVKKTETSTESHDCTGVAQELATRTDAILAAMAKEK